MLFASGFLIGRIAMDRLLQIGILASLGSGLAMVAWTILVTQPVLAVVIPAALFLISFSLIVPNATAGAISPFPHMAGAASSLIGFLQFAAASLVAIAVGWLSDGSGHIMAVAITGSGLFGGLALIWFRQQSASGRETP